MIDTGARHVAFVSLGEGKFEPRDVEIGVSTDDGKVEVLGGLKPGEKVVTSGQFLLDSEASMRESLAKMVQGDLAADQEAEVAVEGGSVLAALPEPLAAVLSKALDSYLSIQDTLANDSTEGVAENARVFSGALDTMEKIALPGNEHFWHMQAEPLEVALGASEALASSSDLAEARLALGNLSPAFRNLLKATGVPPGYRSEVQALHCPMFRSDQGGAVWLQTSGDVRNPYMGSAMLTCFDDRSALPVTGEAAE